MKPGRISFATAFLQSRAKDLIEEHLTFTQSPTDTFSTLKLGTRSARVEDFQLTGTDIDAAKALERALCFVLFGEEPGK